MKVLARQVRLDYGLTTPRVLRSDLRRIYRDKGVKIDLWPHRLKQLRGAYFYDELGATVMLVKGLPEAPMVFTMAHELKHHLTDRDAVVSYCAAKNQDEPSEIGAEVFAAELIFPEGDFISLMNEMGVQPGRCSPEDIVRLRCTSHTTLSYAGLAKRAVFLDYASASSLEGVKWVKLEEQIYGVPFYRRRLRLQSMARQYHC
jgi:hypothetical protein